MRLIFRSIRRVIFWLILLFGLWYLFGQGDRIPSTPEISQLPSSPDSIVRPPDRQILPLSVKADEVFVHKLERKLRLLRQGTVIAEFDIALGFAPDGHKIEQGDGKTPVGEYRLDWRNPQSFYYRSMHVSYPSPEQVAQARAQGRDPGGDIMIHGQPNGSDYQGFDKIEQDWTAGCIAVANAEMDEIWARVDDGTKITIIE